MKPKRTDERPSSRGGLFAVVLLCVAKVVAAQSAVYQCKGADGRISFSDQPCPGQSRARVQPSGKATRLTDSEREVTAKNMGTDGASVRKIEAACAQGSALACDTLEAFKLPKYRALTLAERQAVIRNSGFSERTVRELEEECLRAINAICGTLHVYKTHTQAEVEKDIVDRAKRACAQGDRQACEGLTAKGPFERTPEQARKDDAELKNHLRDIYARRCTEGDKQACRDYQKLKQ